MIALVWGVSAGVALWFFLSRGPWIYPAVGWALGILMHSEAAMVSGLLMSISFTRLRSAEDYERRRDKDEQDTLLFVERLQQLVRVRGTLTAALDELGYRSSWTGSDAGERVLGEIADRYHVHALHMVHRVARTIRRHGGEMTPILGWASDTIQEAQSRRHARQIEESGRRATILILSVAPIGVVAVFALLIPSFYRNLERTVIGDAAILLVGITTTVVFWILADQVRKEAAIR